MIQRSINFSLWFHWVDTKFASRLRKAELPGVPTESKLARMAAKGVLPDSISTERFESKIGYPTQRRQIDLVAMRKYIEEVNHKRLFQGSLNRIENP